MRTPASAGMGRTLSQESTVSSSSATSSVKSGNSLRSITRIGGGAPTMGLRRPGGGTPSTTGISRSIGTMPKSATTSGGGGRVGLSKGSVANLEDEARLETPEDDPDPDREDEEELEEVQSSTEALGRQNTRSPFKRPQSTMSTTSSSAYGGYDAASTNQGRDEALEQDPLSLKATDWRKITQEAVCSAFSPSFFKSQIILTEPFLLQIRSFRNANTIPWRPDCRFSKDEGTKIARNCATWTD